ncbi:SMEK domain-containing protein [Thiothrix lacustris]|uniref:SMEK domain-containing protein n=1 Tax=Thiothrix lacustris TaxID=525917 RepID=UPI0004915D10
MNSITKKPMKLSGFYLINNTLVQTDINKNSEDFLCQLLNKIYNLKLIYANRLVSNYPVIDLGDEDSRICFPSHIRKQVMYQKHASKGLDSCFYTFVKTIGAIR